MDARLCDAGSGICSKVSEVSAVLSSTNARLQSCMSKEMAADEE
jgi:hypothetical protein